MGKIDKWLCISYFLFIVVSVLWPKYAIGAVVDFLKGASDVSQQLYDAGV